MADNPNPDIGLTEESVALAEPSRVRKIGRWVLMLSVPLILLGFGVYYWIYSDRYASTDNAYVQQDIVSVSAEVGGKIIEVAVRENQKVKAGDLLFAIDPMPFELAVAQSKAQIRSEERRVGKECRGRW